MINMRKEGSIGPTAQKVLVLLLGGLALYLTYSPKKQFRIIKQIGTEWKNIDRRALYYAIKSLYQNKLIDGRENADGTVTLRLTQNGKAKALIYNLDDMKIPVMKRWDKKWRVILFDIPEKHKKSRDALARALRNINCHQFQKSVFVHPFECRNEIDFVIESFSMRPYVRFIVADSIDNELHLKKHFDLL